MQNAAIAAMFDEIADCLEIAGDNPFKIRAYRRAAEAVATYPDPIEDAAETGRLEAIEGLGEATSAKVREFLATGTVRYLERLREEYPPGLLELMRVPNLGPKKVAVLHRERGIDSLESLTAAIDAGRLAGLAGFGPKTIENIRQGIARLAEMTKRMPLTEAVDVGARLVSLLSAVPGVERAEIAGSLRRGCDTLGNLNFVAQTGDTPTVAQAFVALPGVLSVVEPGDGETVVCVRPGIEARLRCAPAQGFGATLFHATGSAAHVAAAAQRAEKLGLTLRPDGLWRDGQRLPVSTEAELYEALGVPFIEPELREDRGEWDAAAAGQLPRLVELADLRGDLHTHSTWSDGAVSIRQMAEAARARGYAYFAVTDHSKALTVANGLTAERLREQAKEINAVQADFPDLKILRGVECDIMRDGTLDLDDDILHELDIVVASVHSAFKLDEAAQTSRMVRALSHPAVDIVAHPTGRILGGRPGYEVNVAALIEAAAATGTALEINASYRLDLDDRHAFAARAVGVSLSIDSDAHSARMLPNVAFGLTIARRAWCEARHILNAKTTDELVAWLGRPNAA